MAEYEDKTPYARVFMPTGNAYPGGVFLAKQDATGTDGKMPLIRRMIAHGEGPRGYYLGMELWRKPPREFPPGHIGDSSVGMVLDLDEAAALLASLAEWVAQEAGERAVLGTI